MVKICLIGNYLKGKPAYDGQRLKVRLYHDVLIKEGYDVKLVDLALFSHHPFSVFRAIKNGIKSCDVVLLLAASNGAELLIPFINRVNKKYKKRFVFSLIGTALLHKSIDKLSDSQKIDFLVNKNYSLCKKRKRISRELLKLDCILPETDLLTECYKKFFGLNNVFTLTNFRDFHESNKLFNNSNKQKIVYISRVANIKGIFDLLEAMSAFKNVSLDIYGPYQMTLQEQAIFERIVKENENINYKGCIDQSLIIETISKYKCFVFPTRYLNEGTPGVLSESLIAGVPVLCSSFPQSKSILIDGYDSIFYEMGNVNDLKSKLNLMLDDKRLAILSKNAKMSGKNYVYSEIRSKFLDLILGENYCGRTSKN